MNPQNPTYSRNYNNAVDNGSTSDLMISILCEPAAPLAAAAEVGTCRASGAHPTLKEELPLACLV